MEVLCSAGATSFTAVGGLLGGCFFKTSYHPPYIQTGKVPSTSGREGGVCVVGRGALGLWYRSSHLGHILWSTGQPHMPVPNGAELGPVGVWLGNPT